MANPILNDNFGQADERVLSSAPMTINGTINKTFLLFVCKVNGSLKNLKFSMVIDLMVQLISHISFFVDMK